HPFEDRILLFVSGKSFFVNVICLYEELLSVG
ncbi:unnamed protein product, partial [marine sediment metagenome]